MRTLATAHPDQQLDPFTVWQIANSAELCLRMAAIITAANCKLNRERTNMDCRCNGCGGLDNQAQPQTAIPIYAWDFEEKGEPEEDAPSGSASIVTENDAFSALNEIIDQLYEDPAPGDDFDDVELDLDDDELLLLFPELAEDPQPDFQRFSEYQTEAPRRAVYRGRCKKCEGYMMDVRERRSENVFRCLACGWRTSPEYEHNRAIHAAGGVIICG